MRYSIKQFLIWVYTVVKKYILVNLFMSVKSRRDFEVSLEDVFIVVFLLKINCVYLLIKQLYNPLLDGLSLDDDIIFTAH